jgi:hypothetical protein
VLRGELFEHFDIGGITGFGFSAVGQLQVLEEDGPQLLGRIYIEAPAGQPMDLLFPLIQFVAELLRQHFQMLRINAYTGSLHLLEYRHQLHFHIIEKPVLTLLLEQRPIVVPELQRAVYILAGVVAGPFDVDIGKAVGTFIPPSPLCRKSA